MKNLVQIALWFPSRNVSNSEDVLYDNMLVGERTLGEKMKTYREKQNVPCVPQTIQSGRQPSQSLTSQVLKQIILWL